MYAWEKPRCPACDRPASAAASGSACPACGCPPYARVEVLRFPQPARIAVVLTGVALCAAALSGRDWGRWTPATLMALGILVLVTQAFIFRRGRRAVFWDGGLAVLEGTAVVCRAAGGITGAALDEAARAVVLRLPDGVQEIPLVFFVTHARAETFVRRARRAAAAPQAEER